MGRGAARDAARRRRQPQAALGGSCAEGGRHAFQPGCLGRRPLPAGGTSLCSSSISPGTGQITFSNLPYMAIGGCKCIGCTHLPSYHACMQDVTIPDVLGAAPLRQRRSALQVSEWVQRILVAGDAFAGSEGGRGLRALLATQAGRFFAAYHVENTDALHSMLEKELWHSIPATAAGMQSPKHQIACLYGRASSATMHVLCAWRCNPAGGFEGQQRGRTDAEQSAPGAALL